MSAGITDLRYVWRGGKQVLQYNDQQGSSLDWHDVPAPECEHGKTSANVYTGLTFCDDCGARRGVFGWERP